MNTELQDVALECAARGWYVFPCVPRSKHPATKDGFKSATLDPAKIREWWGKNPQFNVGIACGKSDLCVVDCDYGIPDTNGTGGGSDLAGALGIGRTFAVRTGRRPGFGLQIYLQGAIPDSKFEVDGEYSHYQGDVKSLGGYVMAPGSIHPSGEKYEVFWPGGPSGLYPTTNQVRALKRQQPAVTLADEAITSDRNSKLTQIAGKLRTSGLDADTLRETLHGINERRCEPPLSEAEVDRIADNASKWALPEEDVAVTIGGKGAAVAESEPFTGDWSTIFHTREDLENTPDPEFLIDGFLQAESVTGIIGPARARKSIVTLNVIHSLLTGDKLFGKFDVPNKPERVVYLCPESGKKSLIRRIRNMKLAPYVGDRFFFTSMNSDPLELNDPRLRAAVKGSVLFVDTAIRFFRGDENSSQDMKLFGEQCHGLIRDGVQAIVLLHHTAKGAESITLESGRGSGDFGGFLTCCWGTTISDLEDSYNAQSHMSCVKQRDFQADSFKLAPSGDQDNFFLQYVEGSENARVQVGAKEKAGKAKAVAFARAHPDMTADALRRALAEQGIDYSESACRSMLRGVKNLKVSEA